MTGAYDWQGAVGDNWAKEWQRTDRSFAPLNARLVDRCVAQAQPGCRILDIGCGAGDTSLALAARLPDADIRGVDLSPTLVAAARERDITGAVRFEAHDATRWTGGDWHPDLIVSRHGVMFFDDPVAAFAHFAGLAAPGARIVFSCFQARHLNGWADEIASLLPRPPSLPDPDAPGPFAFADPDRVRDILSRSGWLDAREESVPFDYVTGAGEDPIADAIDFIQLIGPAAPLIRTLTDSEKIAFFERVSHHLRNRLANGAVMFNAAAWIWSAHL